MEPLKVTQIIQFDNDVVVVSYSNGAGLQLSPCGSVFTFYQPLTEGEHPLHGKHLYTPT
jgi:hypothetical protein